MFNSVVLSIISYLLGSKIVPSYGDFLKVGFKNYYISHIQTNWFVARDICSQHNAELANIESAKELDAISKYLIEQGYEQGVNNYFWISLFDVGREPGHFYSITTGRPMSFARWTPGQPDNYGGYEHCVHLWWTEKGYGMNDNDCLANLRAICEEKTHLAIPPTFAIDNIEENKP
ncbi:C-type lectin 37Db-like [Drosophila persimilis]|uniref:C-type lectin 37Db-like n=1 Tax=Drosophila persimilis TaxID=7234 RepID=UPI000F075BFE|nr:C-type lectin 37Db-like [Drosophila persimilis]